MLDISEELLQIFTAIKMAGGYPLIVGGAIRDYLLGQAPKDLDIEVYQIQVNDLLSILTKFGKADPVGMSFGIIKFYSKSGKEYDFSLPRRENKNGTGHRGFIVSPDPQMTPIEACSRRDFTINAMAFDYQTSKILDFFNGQKDLKARILRHTSPAFVEDPLRVLRGFQFVSRFALQVTTETAALCSQLKSEYQTLAKERIWGEWEKWATKSINPSMGLKFLVETQWISCYPVLEKTIGVPQNPEWHPEGPVFEHTCYVVDAACDNAIRDKLTKDQTILSVLTGLCHDLGKPETTILDEGIWRSPGHPEAGIAPSETFLEQIGAPSFLKEKCLPLVKEHLAYLQVSNARNVRRLATRLGAATIEELLWIIEADHSGRPPLPQGLPEQAQTMKLKAQETKTTQGRQLPILMGKHLIEKSLIEPGPAMGKLLKAAYEAQVEGQITDLESGLKFAENFLHENKK